jgi:PAS domain S-box-containing protein
MQTAHIDTIVAPHVLLADVASCLAADGDIVRKAMQVLDHVTRATGASECSLWLGTTQGLVVAARAGTVVTPSADVAPLFEAGDTEAGPLCVRRLAAGSRRLGALVLRVEGGVSPDVATTFSAIAHMMAPTLAWAEQSRTFVAEAERRTKQLDEERRLIHQVVDSLPVSLYVVDREYRITVWNRKREAGSQGVSREQALGKTLFEILHRAPAEKLKRELDEVFQSGRIQQFNMETKATGEPRTYRITKIPMQAVDGEPFTHVITIGEDVTDLTATGERIARTERLAEMGQLAASVVADLAEPLRAIAVAGATLDQSLEDLARDGATVPDHATEAVRSTIAEATRGEALVRSLMDFSRAERDEHTRISPNDIVGQAIAIVGPLAAFQRLTLQTFLDPAVPLIDGSAEHLRQVVISMLQNAADAMESGGTVTLRTHQGSSPAEAVVIEVIDEGKGIARGDLRHIFEPFYSTKGPGRGTGLGLSICHSIVTRHRGRIEVDSAVGAGSTFRILLPGAPIA